MNFSSMSNNEVAVYYAQTRSMEAKEEVIRRYDDLVLDCVKQYRYRPDYEDLEQEGRLAMLHALDAYKPHTKFEFSTIAVHYISGKVRHFLRDKGSLVRIPAWVQDHYRKENMVRATFQAETGREPTIPEIAQMMGITETKLCQIHSNNPPVIHHCTITLFVEGTPDARGKLSTYSHPDTMIANIFGGATVQEDGLFDHDELLALQNASVTELMHTHHLTMFDARKVKEYAGR